MRRDKIIDILLYNYRYGLYRQNRTYQTKINFHQTNINMKGPTQKSETLFFCKTVNGLFVQQYLYYKE